MDSNAVQPTIVSLPRPPTLQLGLVRPGVRAAVKARHGACRDECRQRAAVVRPVTEGHNEACKFQLSSRVEVAHLQTLSPSYWYPGREGDIHYQNR